MKPFCESCNSEANASAGVPDLEFPGSSTGGNYRKDGNCELAGEGLGNNRVLLTSSSRRQDAGGPRALAL